jgi:hypothetical protein
MKRGDTGPNLITTLGLDGLDLTAATVQFKMREADHLFRPTTAATVIDKPGSVSDLAALEVTYSWDPGDTDLPPGHYCGEFMVTLGSGQVIHFPNDGWLQIRIYEVL